MNKKILKIIEFNPMNKGTMILRYFIRNTYGSIRIFNDEKEANDYIEYEKKCVIDGKKAQYKIYNTIRG